MPFTISHAVLAPPLAKLSGDRLPIAAIAIGCMTPDLHRLFTQANSKYYPLLDFTDSSRSLDWTQFLCFVVRAIAALFLSFFWYSA